MSVLLRGRASKGLVLRKCLATHAPLQEKDCTSITPPYHALQEKLALVRKLLNKRPLTLAEKILYSHLTDPEQTISGGQLKRGETYLLLHPQARCYFSPIWPSDSDLEQLSESCYARCKCTVRVIIPLSCTQSADQPPCSEWRCKAHLDRIAVPTH